MLLWIKKKEMHALQNTFEPESLNASPYHSHTFSYSYCNSVYMHTALALEEIC